MTETEKKQTALRWPEGVWSTEEDAGMSAESKMNFLLATVFSQATEEQLAKLLKMDVNPELKNQIELRRINAPVVMKLIAQKDKAEKLIKSKMMFTLLNTIQTQIQTQEREAKESNVPISPNTKEFLDRLSALCETLLTFPVSATKQDMETYTEAVSRAMAPISEAMFREKEGMGDMRSKLAKMTKRREVTRRQAAKKKQREGGDQDKKKQKEGEDQDKDSEGEDQEEALESKKKRAKPTTKDDSSPTVNNIEDEEE